MEAGWLKALIETQCYKKKLDKNQTDLCFLALIQKKRYRCGIQHLDVAVYYLNIMIKSILA